MEEKGEKRGKEWWLKVLSSDDYELEERVGYRMD